VRRPMSMRACSPACSAANRTTKRMRAQPRPSPGKRRPGRRGRQDQRAVPMPRSKPVASTLQLASADAQIARAQNRNRQLPPKGRGKTADTALTSSTPAASGAIRPRRRKPASPAQVADSNARQAVASTDPQSTASVPAATRRWPNALSHLAGDRPDVVAASAPIPRSARRKRHLAIPWPSPMSPRWLPRARRPRGVVATATRIAASRAMMSGCAPDAGASAARRCPQTVLGDANMSLLSAHFVKPRAVVAMGFRRSADGL